MTGLLPRFTIGDGYALYRGATTGDGPVHRHAAFQIAIGQQDDIAMVPILRGQSLRAT